VKKSAGYREILFSIEQGAFELASQKISKIRDATIFDAAQFLRLLSYRISIKNGIEVDTSDILEILKQPHSPYLSAEVHFVAALNDMHRGTFESASKYFSEAALQYKILNESERHMLCLYNSWSAQWNLVLGPSRAQIENALLNLGEIFAFALGCKSYRVQALVQRQQSAIYQHELNQPRMGLGCALRSVKNFQLSQSPRSDLDLAYLQAADCCLELQDTAQAKLLISETLLSQETRVISARSFLQMKVGEINPIQFQGFANALNPLWREKLDRFEESAKCQAPKLISSHEFEVELTTIEWSPSHSTLKGQGKTVSLKRQSVEGKLLQLLKGGRRSKRFLQEALWPELANSQTLDLRFHKLVSRLNSKICPIVEFDGASYLLKNNLRLS